MPQLTNDEIVEGAIFKSIKDKNNKEQNKNYYQSNAVCMLNELKRIITEDVVKNLRSSSDELLKYNYSSLLKDLCLITWI